MDDPVQPDRRVPEGGQHEADRDFHYGQWLGAEQVGWYTPLCIGYGVVVAGYILIRF